VGEGAHQLVLLELIEARGACREKEGSLAGLRERLADVGSRLADLRERRAAEEEHFTEALREREELAWCTFGCARR